MDKLSNASGATNALEARDLWFGWSGRKVVKGWSLQIGRGACSALVGPNGAGKTTLLRLLGGTLRPEKGKVFYSGVAARSLTGRAIAQRIATVSQDFHLPFQFTALQVVEQGRTPFQRTAFFGELRMTRHDRQVVEQAMLTTGSWALRNRIFNELSGGERQRVRIAMALAQTPKLMLLDEPLQNLDLGWQGEILRLLKQLSEGGVTIVAAIHDLNLVQAAWFTSALLIDPRHGLFQGDLAGTLEVGKLRSAFGTELRCVEAVEGVRFVLPEPESRHADEQGEVA